MPLKSGKSWVSLVITLGAALAVSSCSPHRVKLDENANRVEVKGVVTVWGDWAKIRPDKIDVEFNIQNDYSAPIAVLLRDINCFRGETQGQVRFVQTNVGTRILDIAKGQDRTLLLSCGFPERVKEGKFKVTIEKVLEMGSTEMFRILRR